MYFFRPAVRLMIACLALCLSALSMAHVQTIALNDLPYQDTRALDQLLALNELRFKARLDTQWPQVENILTTALPHNTRIRATSPFFDDVSNRCMRTHEVAACRLYFDLIAFQLKKKRANATSAALAILMRPEQLPWKDAALLDALLTLDQSMLQSALSTHWAWLRHVIRHYLPDEVDLHPMSKVFASVRDTCQSTHTEIACRIHLSDIAMLIKNKPAQAPTRIRTLQQIAYRNPLALDQLLALDEAGLRARLSNWPQMNALLNQYINGSVAIAGDVDFARSRLDCQAWFPGDYFMCRNYLKNLAQLMHSKHK